MNIKKIRPLIIGEVLFDTFPDGTTIMGGAPFNVAWNLKGKGLDPLFISRVGNDTRGKEVLATMKKWGLDTSAMQLDASHPTGQVMISMTRGSHEFKILPDQAYDYLAWEPIRDLLAGEGFSLCYHGTLIARYGKGLNLVHELQKWAACPIFIDINLRKPWYDLEKVKNILIPGSYVKLNLAELETLLGKKIPKENLAATIARTRESFQWQLLIVTLGADGVIVADSTSLIQERATPISGIKDTVGAGDALSSMAIYGLLQKWDVRTWSRLATRFASQVCTIQGATCFDLDFYQAMNEAKKETR